MGIRTQTPQLELYNLDEDPGETRDLASAFPERVMELKALMDAEHVTNPDFPVLKDE